MKIGLVLEGGAMRGVYTAAVLDTFLDNNIEVDGIIGVSAGSLFGVNYCSKQKGRVLRYNLKYIRKPNYMGLWSFLTTGNIINEEFAFHKLPEELDKFDQDTFSKSKVDFYSVVTNIETGKAEYIKTTDGFRQVELFRATSAMPFVSKIVEYEGNKYLDGALSDSIPVDKCFEMGYDKVIVVLTRPKGYRKKKRSSKYANLVYKKYPNLVEKINNRYKMYNETLDKIDKLEKDGKIFVIRPSKVMKIGRIEKDLKKIQSMYDLGIKDCNNLMEKLRKYISK